ncbi:MAG TPA: hypothetical protein VEW68_10695, partial [Patescibacteria group bacterium]|nr:hypothetical protein [Patescibacteria group bacterium]
ATAVRVHNGRARSAPHPAKKVHPVGTRTYVRARSPFGSPTLAPMPVSSATGVMLTAGTVQAARAPNQMVPYLPALHTTTTLDGLGFSLKPPKWLKKAATAVKKAVTIKNVAKVAAITAGAIIAAPVLLPAAAAVAHVAAGGVGLLARGVGTGVGLLERGAVGVGKEIATGLVTHKVLPTGGTAPVDVGVPADVFNADGTIATTPGPAPNLPGGTSSTPPPTAVPVTSAPNPALPTGYDASYGGGGGASAPSVTDQTAEQTTTPEQAGPGAGSSSGTVALVALGGLALLALASRRRMRRAS